MLALFSSDRKTGNKPSSIPSELRSEEETARIENMEYTEVEAGKVRWTLKAGVATYFKDKDLTRLEKVHVLLYLDDGSILEMTGNYGVIHAGVKDIEVSGNVNFALPNGYKVRTENVYYSHGKEQILSRTPVEMAGPGFFGRLSELKYDLKTKKAFGQNGVEVRWQP